jgi:hypothetical protein
MSQSRDLDTPATLLALPTSGDIKRSAQNALVGKDMFFSPSNKWSRSNHIHINFSNM